MKTFDAVWALMAAEGYMWSATNIAKARLGWQLHELECSKEEAAMRTSEPFTKDDFKLVYHDDTSYSSNGHFIMHNLKTGAQSRPFGYKSYAYLDGFVGATAYYQEGIFTADEFLEMTGVPCDVRKE